MAKNFGDNQLIAAITSHPYFSFDTLKQAATIGVAGLGLQGETGRIFQENPLSGQDTQSASSSMVAVAPQPPLYIKKGQTVRSHVIDLAERYHGRLQLAFALPYAIGLTMAYILAILIPFWPWLVVVGTCTYFFRHLDIHIANNISSRKSSIGASSQNGLKLSLMEKLLSAKEKYIGFYLGNLASYLIYIVISVSNGYNFTHGNIFIISGVNGYRDDFTLFCVSVVLIFSSCVQWLMMITNFCDPGIIDTRFTDFDEVTKIFYIFFDILLYFLFTPIFIQSNNFLCGCTGTDNGRKFFVGRTATCEFSLSDVFGEKTPPVRPKTIS
jgi:hypothetical protein